MAGHYKLEILQILMSKVTEFLRKLYVEIEGTVPVNFLWF